MCHFPPPWPGGERGIVDYWQIFILWRGSTNHWQRELHRYYAASSDSVTWDKDHSTCMTVLIALTDSSIAFRSRSSWIKIKECIPAIACPTVSPIATTPPWCQSGNAEKKIDDAYKKRKPQTTRQCSQLHGARQLIVCLIISPSPTRRKPEKHKDLFGPCAAKGR